MVAKHDQHQDLVGVAAGTDGCFFDCGQATSGGLLGEEGVQNHLVEAATTEGQGMGPKATRPSGSSSSMAAR